MTDTSTAADATTFANLLLFLDKAIRDGNLNSETGNAMKTAVREVLSNTFDDWEQLDPTAIDVEDTLRRWENLRKMGFKPGSLNSYKGRFRRSVEMYIKWHENPSSWRPDIKQRTTTPRAPKTTNTVQRPATETETTPSTFKQQLKLMNVITYPFPLRPDVIVSLDLPSDLSKREAKRLCTYIDSLAIDEQPALGPGQAALPMSPQPSE